MKSENILFKNEEWEMLFKLKYHFCYSCWSSFCWSDSLNICTLVIWRVSWRCLHGKIFEEPHQIWKLQQALQISTSLSNFWRENSHSTSLKHENGLQMPKLSTITFNKLVWYQNLRNLLELIKKKHSLKWLFKLSSYKLSKYKF